MMNQGSAPLRLWFAPLRLPWPGNFEGKKPRNAAPRLRHLAAQQGPPPPGTDPLCVVWAVGASEEGALPMNQGNPYFFAA